MKVTWTASALADLDAVLAYTDEHFPTLVEPLESRIRAVIGRLADFPMSARELDDNSGIRSAPIAKYPFRIFYRVTDDAVELLHIHHAARDT